MDAKKEEMRTQMQEETSEQISFEESDQTEQESIKDMLKINIQNYKGYDISVLSIEDLPFKGVEINPSCFVIDDNLIISSSAKSARKIISLEKGLRDSLDSYLIQELEEEAVLPDYSFLYYFDLTALINKITQTNLFKSARPFAMMASKGAVTGEDIDSIIDVLNDISLFVQTYKMSEDGLGESLMYIQIEGLN